MQLALKVYFEFQKKSNCALKAKVLWGQDVRDQGQGQENLSSSWPRGWGQSSMTPSLMTDPYTMIMTVRLCWCYLTVAVSADGWYLTTKNYFCDVVCKYHLKILSHVYVFTKYSESHVGHLAHAVSNRRACNSVSYNSVSSTSVPVQSTRQTLWPRDCWL